MDPLIAGGIHRGLERLKFSMSISIMKVRIGIRMMLKICAGRFNKIPRKASKPPWMIAVICPRRGSTYFSTISR